MKIEKIDYKVTTTDRLKCNKCKRVINGKEGYIKITTERERGLFGDLTPTIRICWGCFEVSFGEIIKDRKNRKKTYDNLLRKRILIGLK